MHFWMMRTCQGAAHIPQTSVRSLKADMEGEERWRQLFYRVGRSHYAQVKDSFPHLQKRTMRKTRRRRMMMMMKMRRKMKKLMKRRRKRTLRSWIFSVCFSFAWLVLEKMQHLLSGQRLRQRPDTRAEYSSGERPWGHKEGALPADPLVPLLVIPSHSFLDMRTSHSPIPCRTHQALLHGQKIPISAP